MLPASLRSRPRGHRRRETAAPIAAVCEASGRGALAPREPLQLGDESAGAGAQISSRGVPTNNLHAQRRHEVIDLAHPRRDGEGVGRRQVR